MTNHTPKTRPLPDQLLNLYDDYSELDTCSAFFYDAVAALSSKTESDLDPTSAEGLRFFSEWLKQKSALFKTELNATWLYASSQERH